MAEPYKYIQPIAQANAQGLVADVYAQSREDMGILGPPHMIHSPIPELLAGEWSIFRESLIAGHVARATKEAVASTIAALNDCPFCVDAHTIVLHAAGEHRSVKAIVNRRDDPQLEPELRAIIQWATSTLDPDAAIVRDPPFAPSDAAELIGAAVTFHYLTRMVNALLPREAVPGPRWLKPLTKRLFGRMYTDFAQHRYAEGASLHFLPEASLPADLNWAAPSASVAGAFARFAAAVDTAGTSVLTPEVRACVQTQIDAWRGEHKGISRCWVDDVIRDLDEAAQAAAQLCLLIAITPFQIEASAIESFRAYHAGDTTLVGALAWASFAAARKIGSWLQVPVS